MERARLHEGLQIRPRLTAIILAAATFFPTPETPSSTYLTNMFHAFCMHVPDSSRSGRLSSVMFGKNGQVALSDLNGSSIQKTPIVRRGSIDANLSFHRFAFLVVISCGKVDVYAPTTSETHTRVAWSCSLRGPKRVAR
jgi:hypothetical protein